MMSSQQLQTKKVAFDSLLIKGISCNFSPEEIKSYWWTKEDYAAMRRRDAKIYMLHENGNPTGRKLATAGLILDEPRLERKQRIRRATMAVLLEQETQLELRSFDSDYLAVVSRDHFFLSRRFAHQRGLDVAQQVRDQQVSKDNKARNTEPSIKTLESRIQEVIVEDTPPKISLDTIREASLLKPSSKFISPRRPRATVGRLFQMNSNNDQGIRQL